MKFLWTLVKVLASVLLFGLLANYLYFAFMNSSSMASGWALGLFAAACGMCFFGYMWAWALLHSHQKTPLDAYIENVHKEEELMQQAAVNTPQKHDNVTPVLEQLVASSTKNTTTLNLAMENLNSRLDDLEEKFIRRQIDKEVPQTTDSIPEIAAESKAEAEVVSENEDNTAAPSGNYDDEFAAISDLEIMHDEPAPEEDIESKKENAILKEETYDEINLDALLEEDTNKK